MTGKRRPMLPCVLFGAMMLRSLVGCDGQTAPSPTPHQ